MPEGRVYIHYEEAEPAYTWVWKFTNAGLTYSTLAELLFDFCEEYNNQIGKKNPLEASKLTLFTPKNQPLGPPDGLVGEYIADKVDLFVTPLPHGAPLFFDPSKKRAPRPQPASAKPSVQQPPAPPPKAAPKPAAKKVLSAADKLKKLQKQAEDFESKGNFKNAWGIYEQILDAAPTVTKELGFALAGISRLAYKAKKYDVASDYGQRLVALDATNRDAATALGHVFLDWGDYPKALECFKVALNNATVLKADQSVLDDLKVQIARVLYKSGGDGEQDSAISILTSVLGEKMEHQGALLEYGIACLDRAKPSDALRIFLRLLVSSPEDKLLRSWLATAVEKGGVEAVTEEIDPTLPNSAPALAFLALIVKDYSCIDEAVELYKLSLKLAPANVSYALNLVHTLEVKCQYKEAMAVLRSFLEANPDLSVGKLTAKTFLAAAPGAFTSLEEGSTEEFSPLDVSSGKALPERAAEVCPALLKTGAQVMAEATKKPKHPYSDNELDLLALFYTAIKLLFVSGHTGHLLELAAVIEPVRGQYELHLTTIRNENAYYCCVIQLLTCPGVYKEATSKPIYVVGDSHSLSPAWRSIEVKGEERLLLGRLVTGLKMWHLRSESRFFPKANFEAAVSSVPNGSECVFIFGEIDCREGLVVCVEKCRYDDIEEGAEVTIKIYLEQLVKLIKAKNLTIYIHPVNPVIKETRHIVKIFNKTLKKMVSKYSSSVKGRLILLDFKDELLTGDGASLKEEFNLDGTHVHPNYLKVLEKAVNEAI